MTYTSKDAEFTHYIFTHHSNILTLKRIHLFNFHTPSIPCYKIKANQHIHNTFKLRKFTPILALKHKFVFNTLTYTTPWPSHNTLTLTQYSLILTQNTYTLSSARTNVRTYNAKIESYPEGFYDLWSETFTGEKGQAFFFVFFCLFGSKFLFLSFFFLF